MRIILLSLTSLIILLVPQLAFASSDEEGTVTWFGGTLGGREDPYQVMRGEREYIEINFGYYDIDTVDNFLPMKGQVDVFDPINAVKSYRFSIDELDGEKNTITYVNFLIGDEAPLGTYRYHITADRHNAEEYWGEFQVVDHYSDY